MSTDTKIKTLIFNRLTQEQYNNADKVPTEFYLTPDTSIDSSEKGAANGIATLDINGKVPAEQIPVATASALGGVKPDGTTITVTEDGTISAAISGEVVATKADLQYKVNKTGDTMTGELKMSGMNQIKFGTDDNFYYIRRDANNGNFIIYANNNKGLYLGGNEKHEPFYWNGTNGFRLLTTADKGVISGWGMPSSRYIDLEVGASGSTYTAPANGYFIIRKNSTAAAQAFYFHNNTSGMSTYAGSPAGGWEIDLSINAKKGDIVEIFNTLGGATIYFRFIYAEGAE